jgi:endonuclease VIII
VPASVVGQLVSATATQRRLPPVKVDGHRLTGMDAYGEHLLIDAANGDSVHVHLGMLGKWPAAHR